MYTVLFSCQSLGLRLARPPGAAMLNPLSTSSPEIFPFPHKPQLTRLLRNEIQGVSFCGLEGGAVLDPFQNHLGIVDVARSNLWVCTRVLYQVRLEILLAVCSPGAMSVRAVKPKGEMSR